MGRIGLTKFKSTRSGNDIRPAELELEFDSSG